MNFFFIGSLFLITHPLFSQSPVVEWQKLLGGNNGEYPNSIEHTSDGGFIVAGITEGADNGDIKGYHGNPIVGDLWVVKMDNAGNVQWKRCFGGSSIELGYSPLLPPNNFCHSTTGDCENNGCVIRKRIPIKKKFKYFMEVDLVIGLPF